MTTTRDEKLRSIVSEIDDLLAHLNQTVSEMAILLRLGSDGKVDDGRK
jgi:hypothetical protein